MDIHSSKMMAGTGTSSNGAGGVWRESVSSGMRTVEAVIRELSQNDVPVLVVAESGSGKQAAAARIHAFPIGRWNLITYATESRRIANFWPA